MAPVIFELDTWQAILVCLLFAVIYVASLYVWADSVNKNRYNNTSGPFIGSRFLKKFSKFIFKFSLSLSVSDFK